MWCGVAWWMPLVFTAPLVIFFCLTSVTISVSVCSFLAVWDCGCLPLVGIVFFTVLLNRGKTWGGLKLWGWGFQGLGGGWVWGIGLNKGVNRSGLLYLNMLLAASAEMFRLCVKMSHA
jgi:hypothetical protein